MSDAWIHALAGAMAALDSAENPRPRVEMTPQEALARIREQLDSDATEGYLPASVEKALGILQELIDEQGDGC